LDDICFETVRLSGAMLWWCLHGVHVETRAG